MLCQSSHLIQRRSPKLFNCTTSFPPKQQALLNEQTKQAKTIHTVKGVGSDVFYVT